MKKPELPKPVTSERSTSKFNSASSALSGSLEGLERQKKELEADIKTDEAGVFDYEQLLFRLRNKKRELEGNMAGNEEWISGFKANIGPFEAQYNALVEEIHSLYGDAKEKHAKGVQILVDEFQYHPAYKRWDDEFTAVPFKPA
eukprot:CAMPEP_0197575684 /NCGR_PEP_ID=MMETSP1326-20131121/1001_1 /TAXON_ID=1155430 /ORGANISM="Genus nov. species nov., Strain RCC2288" /LENGTH=143 /DNA_ID=CAMNT_0043138495 /DNA_START=236 /DNA_END=667 /DNA_ORIENTATION=+